MLPERFLRRARQWPLYAAWRVLRESQQLRRFNDLMTKVAASETRYSVEQTKSVLAVRAASRRSLEENIKPAIAAFGTREWEDKGLWQALSRQGDFSLFDYTAEPRIKPASRNREHLGRSFLDHVQRRGDIDIAFFYASGEHVDPHMIGELSSRGIWTVAMSLDDKQQLHDVRTDDLRDWQIELARRVDLYWTTWRAGADWLLSQDVNPWLAPEAADPEIFRPIDTERDIDVLWLGRAYGRRLDLIRYLRRSGFELETFGPGWRSGPVPFDDMIRLYSRAHVVLGMGGVGQGDRVKHLKGRDFEVPMCGAVYLTSFNPELADHFAIGSEILCYSSFEECAEMLSWILRRPDVAADIRTRARSRAIAAHTWDRRITSMLSLFTNR